MLVYVGVCIGGGGSIFALLYRRIIKTINPVGLSLGCYVTILIYFALPCVMPISS